MQLHNDIQVGGNNLHILYCMHVTNIDKIYVCMQMHKCGEVKLI